MSGRRKPRLLVLNQYYWPGIEATAQLLTELCEALSEDLDVKVVTGQLHGQEAQPHRSFRNGVEILRVPSTSFERSMLLARSSNYATYLTSTMLLIPLDKSNHWSRSWGVDEKFVVMHSGNVGHAQDLDSLIRAGTFLRDLDDLLIMIIGMGARHAELVALAGLLEVDQVQFLYYQSRAVLPQSLSAADVHVVGLAAGLAGYVVPSRLYGILAVSRPVIVAADAESETAQLVSEAGCGIVVPPGRPQLLARARRARHDGT